jgi:hypothetical protein
LAQHSYHVQLTPLQEAVLDAGFARSGHASLESFIKVALWQYARQQLSPEEFEKLRQEHNRSEENTT